MATLLENWRNAAYGNGMNKTEQEALGRSILLWKRDSMRSCFPIRRRFMREV